MLGALFPFRRSVGRGEYAIRLLGYFALYLVIRRLGAQVRQSQEVGLADATLLLIYAVFALFVISSLAGRLRAIGWSPWVSIVMFVPIVNAVLLFGLVFPKGRAVQEYMGASEVEERDLGEYLPNSRSELPATNRRQALPRSIQSIGGWALVVLGVGVLAVLVMDWIRPNASPASVETLPQQASFDLNSMSPTDAGRIQEIMANVYYGQEADISTRSEYWSILDEAGTLTDEDERQLKDLFLGIVEYQRLFIQDLRVAVARHEPYTSPERSAQLEQILEQFPGMAGSLQGQDAEYRQAIETGYITIDGESFDLAQVLDVMALQAVGGRERLETLLTRPDP